jgi:hypothetical protein
MIPGSRMSMALRASPVSVRSRCLLVSIYQPSDSFQGPWAPISPPVRVRVCDPPLSRVSRYPARFGRRHIRYGSLLGKYYRRGVFDYGRNTDPFVVAGFVLGVSGLPYSRRHAAERHHHRHCPGTRQGCQTIVESS